MTPETKLKKQIKRLLAKTPGVTIWSNPNGRAKYQWGAWVSYGLTTGAADLIGLYAPHGRFIAIETKVGRNKQSPEQIEFQVEIEAHGGVYILAYDLENVLERLEKFGVIKQRSLF